jgi:3-oxoadipate enol-lactonase
MPFLELDGNATHYRMDGNAPVTVTFIHSMGGDLRIWDDVVGSLRARSQKLQFLRYDLRGHGLTEATPPPYSLELFAKDLEAVMDACGTRSAILCGASLGGITALQLAVTKPARVSGLILSGALAKLGDAAYWKERIATVESKGIEAIADEALERWFPPAFRSTRSADVRGWRNMLVRTSLDGYLGACTALRDGDLRSAVRSLRVPTLVLRGSEDGVIAPQTAQEFAESIPAAQFRTLESAGHLPCIDQPAAMAESMLAFLQEQRLV